MGQPNKIRAAFRSALFLFWTVWIPLCLQGQNPTFVFSGKVVDSESGEGLPAATLQENGKVLSVCNAKGEFSFSFNSESLTVSVRYMGYQAFETKLNASTAFHTIPLQASSTALAAVVVTGSRYGKRAAEETVSIEVIGKELIKNTAAVETAEMLNRVPGIQVSDGQANIRGGSGYAYGVGSRVSVLLDGLPILAADQMNAEWQYLPLEITDQIEVIKGASSVLYGSGSMNGIVHVLTTWPGQEPETRLAVYSEVFDQPRTPEQRWYSSGETPNAHGMFFSHTQKIGDDVDLVIGGNSHLERSFRQFNDEQRLRLNIKTRYRIPSKPGMTLGINATGMYENSNRFLLWSGSDANAYRAFAYSDDRYYFFNVDPFWTWNRSKASHQLKTRYFRKLRFGTGTDIDAIANIALADYQFQQRLWKQKLVMTVGGTGSYGWTQSNLFLPELQLDSLGNPARFFELFSAAVFGQLEGTFNRLNVLLGLRYEVNGADLLVEGSIPVLRLGANYRISEQTFARVSFGQSYRMPSLAERFLQSNVGGLNIFPNFDLLPETGINSELGIKSGFRIGKHWTGSLDAALFWMEYDRMTEYTLGFYPPAGTDTALSWLGWKSLNTGRARMAGFEWSIQGSGNFGRLKIQPMLGYTYSFGTNLDDNPDMIAPGLFLERMFSTLFQNLINQPEANWLLPMRSRHLIRMDLQADWKRWGLGINLRYQSFIERYDPNFGVISLAIPDFNDSYLANRTHRNGDCIIDLRLQYRIPKWNCRLSFLVKNIGSLEFADRPGIMNAPRSFNLRWDFSW